MRGGGRCGVVVKKALLVMVTGMVIGVMIMMVHLPVLMFRMRRPFCLTLRPPMQRWKAAHNRRDILTRYCESLTFSN
jgi:hypothetical protein